MRRLQQSNTTLAVGIDVAEARKGLDLVALDGRRNIVDSAGRLSVEQVAALVLDRLRPDIVCIDSPPAWSTAGRSRPAERELMKLGISVFMTPSDPGDHPFYRWMKAGFSVFDAIARSYPRYRGGEAGRTAAEVFPNATAVLLAGRKKRADETKVAFRREVLHQQGIDEGALPNLDRVDAALAALTGTLALEGRCSTVGDADDGVILLPVRH